MLARILDATHVGRRWADMTRRNGDHSRDDMPRYSVLSPDGAPGRERDWRERASECRCEVVVRSSSELGRNSLRWRTRAQSYPRRPIPNVVPDRPGPSLLLLLCSPTSLLVCSAFGLPSGPSELPSSLKSRVPPGRCIQSTQPDISAASVGAGARCDAMRLKRVVSQPQWEQEFAYLFCRPEDPSFPRAFPSSFFRRRPPSPSPPRATRAPYWTPNQGHPCRELPRTTPSPRSRSRMETNFGSKPIPKDGHQCRISQPVIVRRCDALVCRTVHMHSHGLSSEHRRLQVSAAGACPAMVSRGVFGPHRTHPHGPGPTSDRSESPLADHPVSWRPAHRRPSGNGRLKHLVFISTVAF